MQRLCINRFCGRLWSRPSFNQYSQVRLFQPALCVSPDESALPDFTYRALLVDAAGTLLIPSEPAAEVVHVPMLTLAAADALGNQLFGFRCTCATVKNMV